MMNCGIYKITLPSGKFYIGSSKRANKRMNDHTHQLERGMHPNVLMQRSFNKCPGPITASLLFCCGEAQLIFYEQRAIDALQPPLNLSKLAGRVEFTNEVRGKISRKMSEILIGNKRRLGKPHGGESKKKMSEAAKRTWNDPEIRRKRSMSHIGNECALGHKHDAKTRAKISLTHKGKKKSPEHRVKLAARTRNAKGQFIK